MNLVRASCNLEMARKDGLMTLASYKEDSGEGAKWQHG
jgi:hypothetical protein